MNLSLQVTGKAALKAAVDELFSDLEDAITEAVEDTLVRMKRTAEKEVPVDYGDLRASLRTELERMAGQYIEAKLKAGGSDSDAPYAIYVHEGTGKFARGGNGRQTPWTYYDERRDQFVTTEGQPPNPFMERAFKQNIKYFERRVKTAAREVLSS